MKNLSQKFICKPQNDHIYNWHISLQVVNHATVISLDPWIQIVTKTMVNANAKRMFLVNAVTYALLTIMDSQQKDANVSILVALVVSRFTLAKDCECFFK